ncbi:MAG: TetR/AcrR family transcriptional regulator [Ignavibacteria bacterium]|nr:TetR/AcrR family transcriptional regulator [Ignavibacteria bacterium]MCC7159316.1 TetR/AcrR family transcriptional regulator [Ignavibacteria bacterium]
MSIEERKEREKLEMRQLIIKTAMKLFAAEGIENVSIRKIAEKIEYSPGALYSYFKDKGEIIHAIHEEGFEKLYALQRTLDGVENPKEKLFKMGRLYMKFAMENKDYYDLMFIAKGVGERICEKQEWDSGQRSYDYLRNTVKDCIEAGYLKESDIDAAAFAIWGFVHGMAALIIRGRCAMMPEEMINNVVEGSLKFIYSNINIEQRN